MRPHGSIILPHTRARRSRRRLTPTVRRLAFVVMVSTQRIVESELESPRLYAKSQEDLLRARSHNPAPTTVPPPIAALAGNIGGRHVLVS